MTMGHSVQDLAHGAYRTSELLACQHCDLLSLRPPLMPDVEVRCPRCDALLLPRQLPELEISFALCVSALLLFLITTLAPLLTLELRGIPTTTTLAGAGWALYGAERPTVALVVLFCTVLGPGLVLALQCYVVGVLFLGRTPRGLRHMLAWICKIAPWGMLDVFLLGIVVALIKLVSMAAILPGPGLYAFALLVPLLVLTESRFPARALWEHLEILQGTQP